MSHFVGQCKTPVAKDWRVVVYKSNKLDDTISKTLALAQPKETLVRVIRVHDERWDNFDVVYKQGAINE